MRDLDRILLEDERPEPSSGFAASVMDDVLAEALGPPPIPFPWLQFALGFLVLPVLSGLLLWQLLPRLPVPLQVGLGTLLENLGAAAEPGMLWGLAVVAGSSVVALWCYELVGGAD